MSVKRSSSVAFNDVSNEETQRGRFEDVMQDTFDDLQSADDSVSCANGSVAPLTAVSSFAPEKITVTGLVNSLRKTDDTSAAILDINSGIPPIVTEGMNVELYERYMKDLANPLPLQLNARQGPLLWHVLEALDIRSLSAEENYTPILTSYTDMMEAYGKIKELIHDGRNLPEPEEVELHMMASRFFRALLAAGSEPTKFVYEMVNSNLSMFVDTQSKTLQHILKESLHIKWNPNFNMKEPVSKTNVPIKLRGYGVAVVTARPYRPASGAEYDVYDMVESCQTYMSMVLSDAIKQQFPELPLSQIFFNLVPKTRLPVFKLFSKKNDMKKPYQLCHITMSHATLEPSKIDASKVVAKITTYINYFVK